MKRYKLTVPGLSEIKLSQYQKFISTCKDMEDANEIELNMVSIFCNIPLDMVRLMDAKGYRKTVKTLTAALNEQPPLTLKFRYNGIEYGFIPNIEKITTGEEIDAENYIKDVATYDKLMGVLYRPITESKGDQYLIEKYKAQETSLDLPMNIVQGAVLFFYSLMSDLLLYFPKYIKQAVRQAKNSEILEKNGDGIQQSIEQVEETFYKLTKLQKLSLGNSYSLLHTKTTTTELSETP